MVLPLLLLLLLGSICKASHFMGTVMNYYPKTTVGNEAAAVVLRSRTGFHLWFQPTQWFCVYGNCGTEISHQETVLYSEGGGDWLQLEDISTLLLPSNAQFQLWLTSGNWVFNVYNIYNWQAAVVVDLRNRSDTNKANSPPLTNILPLLRVPSNCQRDFNLLAFDPDGDDVRCRYGDASLFECSTCTQPSVLNLSSSCTLSFSPTNSSNEGVYVVQMVMEDFPKQIITLTQTDGSQVVKTNNDSISKIPVQFVVSVDPAVSSCAEGLFLPKFLTPTPANGAQLYTFVNQPVIINITAEALNATISELLHSGPPNINVNMLLPGQFIMSWTPSENEGGESHPICFAVQAISSVYKYHSELRCIVVTVGNESIIISPPPVTTPAPTPTSSNSNKVVADLNLKVLSSLSPDDFRNSITQLIKSELTTRGLPSDVTLRFVKTVKTTKNTGG